MANEVQAPDIYSPEVLRHVSFESSFVNGPAYRLLVWTTNTRDKRGQDILGSALWVDDSPVPLFCSESFAGSPMHADDSDETLRAILGFLTLRPGDTDRDYFDDYTPEQLAWAESTECDYLQGSVDELQFKDVES